MRKAFTLIELVVALGILAVVLSFANVVFRVSIDAQRVAMANAEIMRKLRVITEQLDADFKGILSTYGGEIDARTETFSLGADSVSVNADSIAFFANGDFQSTRQYGGKTIVGNVASIFYGSPDPNSYVRMPPPQERLLLRRQTILAPEAPEDGSDWQGEYYRSTLEQWRVSPPFSSAADWTRRPVIDPNDMEAQLPMYMAKGVDNFMIWYLVRGATPETDDPIAWQRDANRSPKSIDPLAFKFEFTLYDSKGVIKDGRTFTHIVLVDR
jgi:prepilin-type N-terminal cleavage/methylation domain-containing protein